MEKVNVLIVGAGGYGGCGSVEILCSHPNVRIVGLVDQENIGRPYSAVYPHLKGFCDLPIMPPDFDKITEKVDVVFFSTPDGVGQVYAPYWVERGSRVIDFSGDFRFQEASEYSEYARRINKAQTHACPEIAKEAVYGVPELYREDIKRTKVVGNPGCFAISCILGLAPAVQKGLIELDHIVCDAKTGVSGAGKKANPSYHYPHRYETMNAYRIGNHQHVLEIERELSKLAGRSLKVTFTPHVVPLTRGIVSTLYAPIKEKVEFEDIISSYRRFYQSAPFVRVVGPEEPQLSSNVRGTNFCIIWLNLDKRTETLIVVSHIDNLLKGQAGNAVQNMNIMFGLEETTGLMRPSQFP